jgi:hypothetical protein
MGTEHYPFYAIRTQTIALSFTAIYRRDGKVQWIKIRTKFDQIVYLTVTVFQKQAKSNNKLYSDEVQYESRNLFSAK